ncbi:MAG: hypothetical protein AAF236_11830, partial [Verrucomicrobiota bacterium]
GETAAPEDIDPYEWTVESYTFSAEDLINGFISPDRGSLNAPSLPREGASDEEWMTFLKTSNSVVAHYLEIQGMTLPEGSVVCFDPRTFTLVARLPRVAHGSLLFLSERYLASAERYLQISGLLIEGEIGTITDLTEKASEISDHSKLLGELLAVEGVTVVSRAWGEARSGQRLRIAHAVERGKAADLFLDEESTIEYSTEVFDYGTIWEIDPVLSADEVTVDVSVSVENHYRPPAKRVAQIADTEGTSVEIALIDTFTSAHTSQHSLAAGKSRLLGAWKLEGQQEPVEPARMQAVFLTVDVVKSIPVRNSSLTGLIDRIGDEIAVIPEGKPEYPTVAEEIPEGMVVRRFYIPPTFLSDSGRADRASVDSFSEPASVGEPRFTVRATAKDILASAGVPFPPGSSANYLAEESTLVIRNTPENMPFVEAYMMSITTSPEKHVIVRAWICEAKEEVFEDFVRTTRGLSDHTAQWQSLSDRDDVTIVSHCYRESRSGLRSRIETGQTYSYPNGLSLIEPGVEASDQKSGLLPRVNEKLVGFLFEFDPVLGADMQTVDIGFAITRDTAPPARELPQQPGEGEDAIILDAPATTFHESTFVSETIFRDGAIRFVGTMKPSGDERFERENLAHGVFLSVDLVELESD